MTCASAPFTSLSLIHVQTSWLIRRISTLIFNITGWTSHIYANTIWKYTTSWCGIDACSFICTKSWTIRSNLNFTSQIPNAISCLYGCTNCCWKIGICVISTIVSWLSKSWNAFTTTGIPFTFLFWIFNSHTCFIIKGESFSTTSWIRIFCNIITLFLKKVTGIQLIGYACHFI